MAQYTIKSNELFHFGIPGMRWGVRKAQEDSSDKNADRELRKRALKEKQLQKRIGNPMGHAVKKGFAVFGTMAASGVLAATVGSVFALKNAGNIGKMKVGSLLADLGRVAVASATIAGVVSGVSQLKKNTNEAINNAKKGN